MDTPFNSNWFTSTWLKHFKNSVPPIKFEFINGVQFYKNKYLPIYTNIGKNLTKGFHYTINLDKIKKNNNVFLIYDIPTYFKIPSVKDSKIFKLERITQYNGYLTIIKKYSSIDNFIKLKYSSTDRKVLRRRQNRLNESFNVSYKMYYGHIDMDNYNVLIDKLGELLKKRFLTKQTTYHILSKWDYIKELTYPMILNNDAALFVIYADNEPIAMQLCFQYQKKLIGAIPVYDTDYAKYGLGNILTFKVIEWCINHEMDAFDSSKGNYSNKKNISDIVYTFEFHVLFNPKSLLSSLLAYPIIYFFRFKHFLRKKNVHTIYHDMRFKLNKILKKQESSEINYEIVNEKFDINKEIDISQINCKDKKFTFLNKINCDFLYSTVEKHKDVKLYKKNNSNIYYFVGKQNQQKVLVTDL